MKQRDATATLRQWDIQVRYVFPRRTLTKLFPTDRPKSFTEGPNRLVKARLLLRACRGIYVNPHAHSFDRRTLERIALALRPGDDSYLKSALVPP